MLATVYDRSAPRSVRRRKSRQFARQQARDYFAFVGLVPRYEPASNPACEQHHRKLPCARCV
jgi:hypothetical protein